MRSLLVSLKGQMCLLLIKGGKVQDAGGQSEDSAKCAARALPDA